MESDEVALLGCTSALHDRTDCDKAFANSEIDEHEWCPSCIRLSRRPPMTDNTTDNTPARSPGAKILHLRVSVSARDTRTMKEFIADVKTRIQPETSNINVLQAEYLVNGQRTSVADAEKPTPVQTEVLPPEGACILTGAEGEDPDDCTTHDHERLEQESEAMYHGQVLRPPRRRPRQEPQGSDAEEVQRLAGQVRDDMRNGR